MNKDEVALGAARATMNKLAGLFKSRESQVVSLIQVSVKSALDEAEAHWAKDAELNTRLNKELHLEVRELRKKVQATHGPAVVHESCDNPHCNICVGGLYVCSWCGAAEVEAERRVCTGPRTSDRVEEELPKGFKWLDLPVIVRGEDFSYEATCLCSFPKKNGKVRYIVEDRGRLFIQRGEQLEFRKWSNKEKVREIYQKVVDMVAPGGPDDLGPGGPDDLGPGGPDDLGPGEPPEMLGSKGCPHCGHRHPPDGTCV